MPTVGKLKTNLDRMVDDTVNPGDAIDYFNMALRDLAPVAKLPAKVVLSIPAAPGEVTLPVNILEIREAEFLLDQVEPYNLADLSRYGMEIVENQTLEWRKTLPSSGTATIRYYRFPSLLTGDTSVEPEIPEVFHDALSFFAAAEYFNADDEPELAAQYKAKYLVLKSQYEEISNKRGIPSGAVLSTGRPPWVRG